MARRLRPGPPTYSQNLRTTFDAIIAPFEQRQDRNRYDNEVWRRFLYWARHAIDDDTTVAPLDIRHWIRRDINRQHRAHRNFRRIYFSGNQIFNFDENLAPTRYGYGGAVNAVMRLRSLFNQYGIDNRINLSNPDGNGIFTVEINEDTASGGGSRKGGSGSSPGSKDPKKKDEGNGKGPPGGGATGAQAGVLVVYERTWEC